MAHRLLKEIPSNVDARVVFANTGQEDERTLNFVHNCERVFGWDITWVEAKVNPNKGKGTTHRIVNYDNASRLGQPFEEVISKYGIPNQSMPHCTRELKLHPIKSLCKSWGWKKGSYSSAVGIRADEVDRMSSYAEKENLIYPLVKWGVKKPDVLEWWSKQNFDLNIPEHMGNCVWCWKKSYRKLVQVYRDNPNLFDFPERMENAYSNAGAMASRTGKQQVFFRKHLSVGDIKTMAMGEHLGFEDPHYEEECAESCEVFSDSSLREIV
jgi:hypothetical protein